MTAEYDAPKITEQNQTLIEKFSNQELHYQNNVIIF